MWRTQAVLQVIIIAAGLTLPCCAKDDDSLPSLNERLKQLENVVIGSAPANESNEQRILNVELKLYGQQQGGTLQDRLMKAQQTVASNSNKQDDWAATPMPTPSLSPSLLPPSIPQSTDVPTPATPSPTRASANSPSDSSPLSAVPAPDATTDDGWPTALPRLEAPASSVGGPFKIEVSESSTTQKIVDGYKKLPDDQVFNAAQNYFQNHNYAVAEKLELMLADRHPKSARFFYEAGRAEVEQDHVDDAFANYALAWHLGHADAYTMTAEKLVPVLQRQIDPYWKLTWQWQAQDPEAVLNAGTRLWKGGCTKQAIRMFEYALKNEPMCRGAASYNLGAIAENEGNLKMALRYYQWAAKENARLSAEATAHPAYQDQIQKSLNIFPPGYIENAIADVRQKLLRGDTSWHGWTQPRSYPTNQCSEVCPVCAISRTEPEYIMGQMGLR